VDSVDSSIPSGQGTVCAGATLALGAPPHLLNFATTSLASGCTIVTISPVSRISFAAAVVPQKLSSYFTPKPRNANGAYRFQNSHGAVIGQVAGDGFRASTAGTFSNVAVCLDRGAVMPSDLQARFTVWDIAYTTNATEDLTPLFVNTTYDAVNGWCATFRVNPGVYVPVRRLAGASASVLGKKPQKITHGERAVLGVICAIYFLFAVFTPYYCISVALTMGKECLHTATFWLPIFFMLANILRGIYFARIAAADLTESTASDVILVELPTMLRFTAATLMGLFWVAVLVSVGTISKAVIARNFWLMLAILNGVMYALFIAAVIVFSRLHENVTVQCSGRLPNHLNSKGKKTAYIVYQAVIAAMGALVALLYLLGGLGLAFKMRSFQKETSLSHGTTRVQFRLFLVGSLVSATFLCFAVFLLVIALTEPHIPYLALILVFLELVPEAILYWNLPSPKASTLVTGSTATGSGTGASASGHGSSATASGSGSASASRY